MTAGELSRVRSDPAGTTLASRAPWPPLRRTWWVFTVGFVAIVLFVFSYVFRVLCAAGQCGGRAERRLFGMDTVGSIPRLFIVALFVAATVLAWATVRRTVGPDRWWWSAVTAGAATLAVAKLLTLHSMSKSVAPVTTLVAGTALAVVVLVVLYRWGRGREIAATTAVVATLGIYAGTALGLDVATTGFEVLRGSAGFLGWAAGTFVEELGEALTALTVVVALRWNIPNRSSDLEGE